MSEAAQYTSPGPASYTARTDQVTATACPPLSRMIPFGRPVVPDVYRMYSGSAASSATHSAGSAPSIASSQLRSRPSTSVASNSGRCRITHRGEWPESSMARSSSGLYSTTRPGSRPHDAARISFGWQSSMRAASSCAANPPNTTECTAPMRAHASIATTASGTIGM